MGSKLEAGGIAGNHYWAEILMAKTESEAAEAARLIFQEMPLWPLKSPHNRDFPESAKLAKF